MTPENRETADAHYEASNSWASGINDALRSSRRVAWIVAGTASAIALLEALALVFLVPLKTAVPYTLMVDRQTGYVQQLDPLTAGRIAPDSALTRSFLVQYVIAREGFDIATVQDNYRKVTLWSTGAARGDYVAFMQAANPDSPLIVLPRSTAIETQVKSVSSIGVKTSLVRFQTARRDRGGALQSVQHWVAVVTYRYSNAPLSVEDRYLNPLGFEVVRYRRNAETLPIVGLEPSLITPVPPVTASRLDSAVERSRRLSASPNASKDRP